MTNITVDGVVHRSRSCTPGYVLPIVTCLSKTAAVSPRLRLHMMPVSVQSSQGTVGFFSPPSAFDFSACDDEKLISRGVCVLSILVEFSLVKAHRQEV